MAAVQRNPAFRIATGGLSMAAVLCLVAAVSLLHSNPAPEVTGMSAEASARLPIQVATAGDVTHLLQGHANKPVPEPLEHIASDGWSGLGSSEHSITRDQPGPWKPRPTGLEPQFIELPPPPDSDPVQIAAISTSSHGPPGDAVMGFESELAQLKGQIRELVRTQWEGQLVEIRHAEQLLSTQHTARLIETLQREVNELQAERDALAQTRELPPDLTESQPIPPPLPGIELLPPSVETQSSLPPADGSLGNGDPSVAASALSVTPPVSRIRIAETPDLPGRFDVDADEAPLRELLAKLGPMAGWNLVSGPDLQRTVTCRWKGVDLQHALIQLLRVHGWQIRLEGEFAIIEPLPQPERVANDPASSPESVTEALTPKEFPKSTPHSDGLVPPVSAPVPRSDLTPESQAAAIHLPVLPLQVTHVFRPQYVTSQELLPLVKPLLTDQSGQAAASLTDGGDNGSPPTHADILVIKDQPDVIDAVQRLVSELDIPPQQVEIEATILQVRHLQGVARGVFRQALSVSTPAPCPTCGQVHTSTDTEIGHAVDGWFEMGDGVSCGVCQTGPTEIAARLQKHSAAFVTATPRVQVLNRQLAEIGLTEQNGFRRHIARGPRGSEEIGFLEGGVQLSMRPTVGTDGTIRLDVCPSSVSSADPGEPGLPHASKVEFSTSLLVPPGSCVVLGGLYFESERPSVKGDRSRWISSKWGTRSTTKEMYEVVVLISVRVMDIHRMGE